MHTTATIVFATANNCQTLHWESPSRLVVACSGSYIDSDQIDVRKGQSGDVTISYESISLK